MGDGTTATRFAPVQIGTATNWTQATGGQANSVALSDGAIMSAWGFNAGSFGNGDGTTTNSLVPINVSCATLLDAQSFSKTEFSFYPNPATHQINLLFAHNLEKANLKIISILGQTVLEKQNLSGINFSFNVASLSNGTYILQLQEGSNISRSKFVKK